MNLLRFACCWLLPLLALRVAAAGVDWPTNQSLPNIVIILADDLGWGDLSCYGQKKFTTPHIDRLAAEGMRFVQAYAGAPGGAASRGTLLTGKHTGHARIRGNWGPDGHPVALRAEDQTFLPLLKRAGYVTGVIGKWGLGGDGTTGTPAEQRLDQWLGLLELRHATNQFPAVVARFDPKQTILTNNPAYYQPIYENQNGAQVRHAQDIFTYAASNYFRIYQPADWNRFRPFFLHLAFALPNAGEEAGTNAPARYAGALGSQAPTNWPEAERRKAAAIAHLDASVGQLLRQLDDLRMAEQTVVVLTSDNAAQRDGLCDPAFFHSNGPFRGAKGELTEGGLRVPLLARWPGRIKPASTNFQPVALWDLFATVVELAGVTNAPPTDSFSLVPALLGRPAKTKRDYLYWESHEGRFTQAIRAGDWKAIRPQPEAPLELYHLARDPGEARNVAAEYPAVVNHFESLLKSARSDSNVWEVHSR